MLVKQSQSTVKQNNLRLILNTLRQHDALSRAELVRLTHISKPTVSNLVDELLQRNLALEIGEGESSTGRKPILVKFHNTRKYFLVFDIGRKEYQAALSDLKGTLLDTQHGEFDQALSSREKLSALYAGILELLDRTQVPHHAILKIHGSAPGVYVEQGKGMKWFSSGEIPEEHDMQKFFEEKLQAPVTLNHSAKIMLLGEKIAGKAQQFSHVVYIDLGYGLGGAFMFDNRIYFGANNSAGEIGYLFSGLNEFSAARFAPYQFGALESLFSGGALQQKAKELAQTGVQSNLLELVGGDVTAMTARTLFNAAIQGDQHAFFLIKESLRYFTMALCNIINMLNPELVIFGGGLSDAGDFLLDLIVGDLQGKALIMPELTISDLQDRAALIGGAAYLIERTDFLTEL